MESGRSGRGGMGEDGWDGGVEGSSLIFECLLLGTALLHANDRQICRLDLPWLRGVQNEG